MLDRHLVAFYKEVTSVHAAQETPAGVKLSHREVMVILSGLLAGLFLAAIDGTMVSVALPVIVGDLGGLDQLSWVVTTYLLTSTVSVPLYGKLSDIYGRRVVFQTAIAIYLAGSLLNGLSQNMTQLIVFRGIQGLGGGGLMAMSFTILGDILSPRERGKYMGYFSATWALASVAGPLLGGFLVDSVTWRGVFFVKIPVGLAAMAVIAKNMRLPVPRERHRIDFEGAGLLVGGVSCLLLVAVWGGTQYEWGSTTIVSLAVAGLVLTTAFVGWESRVVEPILPLRLFRVHTVTVCTLIGFLIGSAMFGGMVFLPLFFQAVTGASATGSGLLMTPLMAGVTVASIVAGRRITKSGRYRVWPIVGLALTTVALFMLSQVSADDSGLEIAPIIALLGAGMGMVMPVINVAVQNAVPYRDLGTATSAANFFRTMGGAVGVAVFGAVLAARLNSELARLLPADAIDRGLNAELIANRPEQIRALPDALAVPVIEALSRSIGAVFLVTVPVAALAFVIALFLRHVPLRDSAGVTEVVSDVPTEAVPPAEAFRTAVSAPTSPATRRWS
jgi:EmrB/QacA subfamily drug resistance transporter